MEKTDIIAIAFGSFLMGIVVALATVCIVQFMGKDYGSFPVLEIRSVFNI